MLSSYQMQATSYGDLSLPVHERINELHKRAERLAPTVERSAGDSGCTDQTRASYDAMGPRQRMAWDMVAEAHAWNALSDRTPGAEAELAKAEQLERDGRAYRIAYSTDDETGRIWEVITEDDESKADYCYCTDEELADGQTCGRPECPNRPAPELAEPGPDKRTAAELRSLLAEWEADSAPEPGKPPARAESGPRCAVCHRDAHRPGSGFGNHGHAYVAPEPAVLDARRGPVDHACRGCWQYAGLNRGGHETYRCDSGRHVLISAHPAADHVCNPVACEYVPELAGQPEVPVLRGVHHRAHPGAGWRWDGQTEEYLCTACGRP